MTVVYCVKLAERCRYKSLLESIMPQEKEEEEMEVTFTPGYLQKTEELVEKKLDSIVHGPSKTALTSTSKLKVKRYGKPSCASRKKRRNNGRNS